MVKGRLLHQGTWNKDITLILVKTLMLYDKSVTDRVFTVQFYVPQLYLRVRISYRLL